MASGSIVAQPQRVPIGTVTINGQPHQVFITKEWLRLIGVDLVAAGNLALGGGALTIEEVDGSPSGSCTKLVLPNGTLTIVGSVATYTPSGGGSGITALTGDVTATGPGSVAATIGNDVVTYAKMQNVSAASKLLGRGSAGGAGDPEEITLGSGLTMTTTTLSAAFVDLPILNYVTNQINCYGLRLLNIGYGGPLIRVQHATLGTTLEVYPVSGTVDLDWAAITTFAAGGNVGVQRWYDQTRNGDLTQAVTASQPLICIAGSLIPYPGTVAGRYAMKFNGGQVMTGGANLPQDFSRTGVLQFLSVAAGINVYSDLIGNSLNFSAAGTLASFAGANVTLHAATAVNDLAVVTETFYNSFQSRFSYNATQGNYSPGANASTNRNIGGAAGSFFTGLCAEFLHFNRGASTDMHAIVYANCKAYWGTP